MKLYRVSNWDKTYENNRSRKVEDLRWVPIPNAHDGEKYSELITRKDGAEIFAAWILILQVASKCHPRGTLVRSNGHPHDPTSLSLKTRAPSEIFEKALPYLASIGWLNSEAVSNVPIEKECQISAFETSPERQSDDEEGKGREGNITASEEPPKLISVSAEQIYAAYPRKDKRVAALKAIAKAAKTNEEGWLLERVRAYARCMAGKEIQYIPQCATWFNGSQFNESEREWNPAGFRYVPAPSVKEITQEPNGWRDVMYRLWPARIEHEKINGKDRWDQIAPDIQQEIIQAQKSA